MTLSKRSKTLLPLLVLFTLLFSSCTQKPVILQVPDNLDMKVADANKSICSYKGRVSVIYENGHDDVRFRGYLDKDCEDNFRLKILGLFGSVAYDVNYRNGVVQAYERGKDVSREMAYFMRSKGLYSMISLIRYPHAKIDSTYKARAEGSEYVLTKGPVTVFAGQNFLISKIKFGSGDAFSYGYTDGRLTRLTYKGDETKVEINLQ